MPVGVKLRTVTNFQTMRATTQTIALMNKRMRTMNIPKLLLEESRQEFGNNLLKTAVIQMLQIPWHIKHLKDMGAHQGRVVIWIIKERIPELWEEVHGVISQLRTPGHSKDHIQKGLINTKLLAMLGGTHNHPVIHSKILKTWGTILRKKAQGSDKDMQVGVEEGAATLQEDRIKSGLGDL